jgi:iron complex outermembrane receptor protein
LPPANTLNPVLLTLNGNKSYKAEEQLAFEIGYRYSHGNKLSIDLTGFYNDLKNLRTSSPGAFNPISGVPFFFTNNGQGNSVGFEASTVWQMTDWWRWNANYSFIETTFQQPSTDQTITSFSPAHRVSVRAEITPIEDINFDLWLRYNSNANLVNARALGSNLPIHEYVTLDARLGWQVHPGIELSVTGQNLLDNRHLEFVEETWVLPTQIPRGVYGKISVEF